MKERVRFLERSVTAVSAARMGYSECEVRKRQMSSCVSMVRYSRMKKKAGFLEWSVTAALRGIVHVKFVNIK